MKLLTSLLFLGLVVNAEAGSCTDCRTTYTSARDTVGASNTDKCDALKTYLTCLEVATGAGCPLSTAHAAEVGTDSTASSCTFDPLCVCQEDYWGTDISGGSPADCNAAKARLTCLRGTTGTACDGSSVINDLGTNTDGVLTAIAGTCSPNAACTCERTYVKTDVSDDAKMCTASLAFLGCLKGIDGTLCDGTATVQSGASGADTVQSALSSPACSPTGGCACEVTYATADVSDDTKKCAQAGTFISCLKTKTGVGCDGSTTVAAMAGTADTAMTSGITSCTQTDGCVCEAAYAKADISDDTKKCAQAGTFISCLKTKTGAGCDGTTTVAAMAGTADTAMTTTITSCTQTDGCVCEAAYASADISDDTKKCTQAGTFISCLKTKTGFGCDGSTTVAAMAGTADTAMTSGITSCTQTDGCVCEAAYAKADISDDTKKCAQAGTFISCLKTKTGVGCDGTTTVAAMAGTADTAMTTTITSCTQTDGCVCEAAYAKADISDDTKKCAQAGTFISCLKTKTGAGCDGTTTVAAMAGTADTAMTSGITSCTQTDGCVCEAAYAKADISDDTKKCAQAGAFISCLKTKTGAGCDGTTTVAAMAGTADTAMTSGITSCTKSAGCACESTYAQADISDDTKKCTEGKKFIGCLKSETGMGCDGSTTVAALATAANTYIGAVTGCTKSAACECEVTYASADISDDTKHCTEVKKYISCLKAQTGTGCDGTSSVVQLATAAESTAGGITGCTLTGTACKCEADYAKADISDDTKLCTETKTFVDCLKDKADTCADTKSNVVTAAETTMSGIAGSACDITSTVCQCDAEYAKLDVSTDPLKCIASKNYISCLLGKTGMGCDGSTALISSATTAEAAITAIGSSCTKTSVCDCEITYAKADISSDPNKCAATKALTTCIMLSIDNGCGATTTKTSVGTVASAAFTALASACTTTATCDCQATFNAADVSANIKCTSGMGFITCLDAISSTTETACDGTLLTTELKTNATTSIQEALCSFGTRVEVSSFVAVFMMTMSVLVISL